MRFASLGSGSEGNALVIDSGELPNRSVLLVDCGFNLRETEERLARLSLNPSDLKGLVVTHEHNDHVAGVPAMARKYRLPVWTTRGTWQASSALRRSADVRFCRDGQPLHIGSLCLIPFTVPHDAREPVQFVICSEGRRFGILTDAGAVTPHIAASLHGCDALFLECNHDSDMLATSSYPASLRRRIASNYGHLSNQGAVDVLAAIDRSRLKTIVAAHLSKENNTPETAKSALVTALGAMPDAGMLPDIVIASQEEGCGWIDLDA